LQIGQKLVLSPFAVLPSPFFFFLAFFLGELVELGHGSTDEHFPTRASLIFPRPICRKSIPQSHENKVLIKLANIVKYQEN
jgi:hypothetical protein